jgi:hypothetical protein
MGKDIVMKRFVLIGASLLALRCAGAIVAGQPAQGTVAVPFSDPSRPGTLQVSAGLAAIVVKAADVRDVTLSSGPAVVREATPPAVASGLTRLRPPTPLTVEEANNLMSVKLSDSGSLTAQVPLRTNLRLKTANGSVTVEGARGEIEVTTANGAIALTDVDGPVVAHATNGKVLVILRQTAAQKPMSFTSLNGEIDVTVPAGIKADLKLRSVNGEVYTDLDVAPRPGPSTPGVQDSRSGMRRLKVESTIYGSVNGGGPEVELRTFNGNVYLRKRK